MASIIKSNTYADFNGREILTANNDGALTTQNILHPAFHVRRSTSQTGVADNTYVVCQYDDVIFDTDNGYSTSDYKYRPPVDGKYFVYWSVYCYGTTTNNILSCRGAIFKNDTRFEAMGALLNVTQNANTLKGNAILPLTTSDHIKIACQINVSSGTGTFLGQNSGSAEGGSIFGAYRIGS